MSDRSLTAQWTVRGWNTNRIVALYVLIGGAWILLSDRLVVFNAPDPVTAAIFGTAKGLGYVVATATLLHWLINRYTAELRASEERFRIIFEHANDAIHIDTADDDILDVNPRMCELMGYSRDELLTMRIPDLQAPERRAGGRVVAIEQAQHGDTLFESLNLHRDGQRIPVEISVARVARPQGDLYVSVIRDITDRKRAEEALRQSEAFNQALIDHSPLGISVRNRTGQLLFANAAWRKIWAISDPDLHDDMTRDRDALQFNARDEYLKSYQADLRRVYEQGGYLHLPELKTIRPRPGAAEWISQHFYAIVDERGQVDRMVILTEDISDRKRAADALRESEERFRTLVEQSPLSTQALSPDGRTLQVNRAFEILWGITLHDLKEYNILADEQLVRLGLMPYIQRGFSGEAASIPAAEYDSRESVGVGEKKWVQSRIYPVTDDAGNIRLVILIHEDITERKRAEQALRKSEALYRSLINIMPDGVTLTDLTGHFTFASPRQLAMHGGTLEDLASTSLLDWVAPDYQAKAAANIQSLLQGEEPSADHEYRLRRKDGSYFWGEINGAVLRDADGQPQGMVTVQRDITERKTREREIEAIAAIAMALRAASTRAEMLPIIVQQTADLLTADGAALILRDPATDQSVIAYGLGVSADSTGLQVPRGAGIVGHVMTTSQPYLTQDVEHDPLTFRPDLAHGVRAVACTPLIAQDRILGALWAGRTTAITEEETRLLAAIADIAANALHRAEVLETLEQRVYDRTRELAAANERLQELDRLKSKFVSDVSHELRTPITSLMLNVELLEHGKPEKREQYLSVIRQQTTRQVQLIEDILNLSRLELSATRTQFAPVKVNALIDQAVNVYRSSAEAANLRLAFTPAPAEPVVMGVEGHLSQIVTNLIANAIAYTPAGSVEVTTHIADHEVVIQVRDTGLGIAPEDMPHLFDRFYRGKLTWQVRGSGLGLAIVKEITEVHKGRVEVDSQAGVGSTFRVYLPMI